MNSRIIPIYFFTEQTVLTTESRLASAHYTISIQCLSCRTTQWTLVSPIPKYRERFTS